jgi:hypothetical protein
MTLNSQVGAAEDCRKLMAEIAIGEEDKAQAARS